LLVLLVFAVSAAGIWFLGGDEPPAGEAVPVVASPERTAPPQGAAAGSAASEPPAPAIRRAEQDRGYDRCMALALADPEQGVAEARRWRAEGGGEEAAHCEAMARLRAGDGEGAARILEALGRGAFAPGEARAALLAQASQIWLEAGEYTRAYAAITQALVLRPDDPDMLTDRAVIAASAGRFEEAIDDLTRVIDVRPVRAEPYVLRASAWRQIGQAALARDDIARALAQEPLNQEAWLESGFLKQAANDLAGARRDWEQTVRIAPDTATAALAARNIALLSVLPEGSLRLTVPGDAPPQPAPAPAQAGVTSLPLPPPSPPSRPR
jgi:tetratricopeptide (TPR) repeat protein